MKPLRGPWSGIRGPVAYCLNYDLLAGQAGFCDSGDCDDYWSYQKNFCRPRSVVRGPISHGLNFDFGLDVS